MSNRDSMLKMVDEIYTRLTAQDRTCKDYEGACVYKNQNKTLGCAFGLIIPDELYNPKMDHNLSGVSLSIMEVIDQYPEVLRYFEGRFGFVDLTYWETELLCSIQRYMHDLINDDIFQERLDEGKQLSLA